MVDKFKNSFPLRHLFQIHTQFSSASFVCYCSIFLSLYQSLLPFCIIQNFQLNSSTWNFVKVFTQNHFLSDSFMHVQLLYHIASFSTVSSSSESGISWRNFNLKFSLNEIKKEAKERKEKKRICLSWALCLDSHILSAFYTHTHIYNMSTSNPFKYAHVHVSPTIFDEIRLNSS